MAPYRRSVFEANPSLFDIAFSRKKRTVISIETHVKFHNNSIIYCVLLCVDILCPAWYQYYNHSKCYYVSNGSLSQPIAKTVCHAKGGILANAKTAEEDEYMRSINMQKLYISFKTN